MDEIDARDEIDAMDELDAMETFCLFCLFCVYNMSMSMGSAEAGWNEAFKKYKRLFLTCTLKKLCSENFSSSSILYEKRSRRHDFRPTRHLARTFFVEGSKNG